MNLTAKQAQTSVNALSYVCPPGWRLTATEASVEIDRPGYRPLVLRTVKQVQQAHIALSGYRPDTSWTLIAVHLDEEAPAKAGKNVMAKTRPVDRPYQVFTDPDYPGWEWRVLKRYQTPAKEAANAYARAFCAVRSPMTYGSWDMGDTYLSDIGRTLVSEDI